MPDSRHRGWFPSFRIIPVKQFYITKLWQENSQPPVRKEVALTEDLKNAVEEKNMAYIYQSDYLRLREMKDEARGFGKF